jgi:hypothetical protein
MHNRMGDNVQQDLSLTADIMVKLMERLELEWKVTEKGGEERLWIAQLGVFCLAGYARAMRGEEITKIELGGVRKHFVDGVTSATPHVMFTLVGRFKGYQGGAPPLEARCCYNRVRFGGEEMDGAPSPGERETRCCDRIHVRQTGRI